MNTEDVRETVLRAHMHRQQAELLASQEAIDVTQYMTVGGPLDKDEIALLALLQRYRKQLHEQHAQIVMETNAPDEELFIELGRWELPLPDNWQNLLFYGWRLKIVAHQFPPRVVHASQYTDQGSECDDPTCELLHHTGRHSEARQRKIEHDRACPVCWERRCHALLKRGLTVELVRMLRDAGPTAREQMHVMESATPRQIDQMNRVYKSMGETDG